jgi:uncharacterized protein (DUF433 family)
VPVVAAGLQTRSFAFAFVGAQHAAPQLAQPSPATASFHCLARTTPQVHNHLSQPTFRQSSANSRSRESKTMPTLDWSQCSAVESVPGKRSGAWVFRGTRTPVATVFENLQDMSVDELVEEFGVTREQVEAVLQFVAQSAETPVSHR